MCSCTIVDDWNIMPGRSLVVLANGGLSDYVIKTDCSKFTLIKAQFSALDMTLTPKVGHRVSRRLHPSVWTSSGEGYKLTTVTLACGRPAVKAIS